MNFFILFSLAGVALGNDHQREKRLKLEQREFRTEEEAK